MPRDHVRIGQQNSDLLDELLSDVGMMEACRGDSGFFDHDAGDADADDMGDDEDDEEADRLLTFLMESRPFRLTPDLVRGTFCLVVGATHIEVHTHSGFWSGRTGLW